MAGKFKIASRNQCIYPVRYSTLPLVTGLGEQPQLLRSWLEQNYYFSRKWPHQLAWALRYAGTANNASSYHAFERLNNLPWQMDTMELLKMESLRSRYTKSEYCLSAYEK